MYGKAKGRELNSNQSEDRITDQFAANLQLYKSFCCPPNGAPTPFVRTVRYFFITRCAPMARGEVALSSRFSVDRSEPRLLADLDWDFHGAETASLTHGMHPYPAKYIPQIPHQLITELSVPGETVADIFCGSGTALVESNVLGRNSVGVDANPLACLISRAKTSRLNDEEIDELIGIADRALQFAADVAGGTPLFGKIAFASPAERPTAHALSFWFLPFIIEELAETLSWCQGLATDVARDIALASFSAIVITVSNQDSDTRYVRRAKKLKPGDAFKAFARSILNAVRASVELLRAVDPTVTTRVLNADVLDKPDIGELDLVVCSPPYPNAYSYHLYHMTRMLWLQMDQPRFKQAEIGSHRKYSKKGSSAATEETFRNEMVVVFQWLRTHLRKGRHACFVVGDSTLKGRAINNADLISAVSRLNGFSEVARIERTIQKTKKAFNPAIGKIKKEQILILQNQEG